MQNETQCNVDKTSWKDNVQTLVGLMRIYADMGFICKWDHAYIKSTLRSLFDPTHQTTIRDEIDRYLRILEPSVTDVHQLANAIDEAHLNS